MENNVGYHTTPKQIEDMLQELDRAQQDARAAGADKRGRVRRLIGKAGFLLVAALLCYALISIWVARSAGEVPTVFGYQFYSVQTPSMEPTLPVGSVILSKKLGEDDEISKGDIITFHYGTGSYVTHRVLEAYEEEGVQCFKTKGDNPQNSADPWTLHREDIEALFIRKLW